MNQEEIVGEFLLEIWERGLRHDWVAKKIGISKSNLSNIFTLRDTLSEENRKKLNELFGTSIGDVPCESSTNEI